MKIGVVIPTRGFVFTEVEEAVEKMRTQFPLTVYRTHNLVIPDSHNQPALQALKEGATHILFVEEDTVPPENALTDLLEAASDIACIDYAVSGWSCITRNQKGEILWCGLGCTLVSAKVFDSLEYPYFRTDKVLRLNDMTWQDLPEEYQKKKNYGGLDIWFFSQAREKGFQIRQVQGECRHLQLLSLGQREVNNGLHQIGLKPPISKHQVL